MSEYLSRRFLIIARHYSQIPSFDAVIIGLPVKP
jgi:hypothetical protein